MTNLVKTQGVYFRRYKNGNIRWYFGEGDFGYYRAILMEYVGNFDNYYKAPLLYSVLNELLLKRFNSFTEPESIKIRLSEAVALLSLLERRDEKDFLYHELRIFLRL